MRTRPVMFVAFILLTAFALSGALLPGCKAPVSDEASCEPVGGMEQRGAVPPAYLECPPGRKKVGEPWSRENYHSICCVPEE